jgi:hypothetical protein
MAAAGAAASIAGQQQQKKAAEGYENEKSRAVDYQAAETRRRATADYINQVRLEETQQRQEEQAVVEKSGDLARQTNAAVATGMASAAERNVAGGRTLDSVLDDYRFQENMEIGRMKENQRLKNLQHRERMSVYERQYYNNATSVQPYQKRPVQPVDYFGPIFGAVSQTANTFVRTGGAENLFREQPRDFSKAFGVVKTEPMYADGE